MDVFLEMQLYTSLRYEIARENVLFHDQKRARIRTVVPILLDCIPVDARLPFEEDIRNIVVDQGHYLLDETCDIVVGYLSEEYDIVVGLKPDLNAFSLTCHLVPLRHVFHIHVCTEINVLSDRLLEEIYEPGYDMSFAIDERCENVCVGDFATYDKDGDEEVVTKDECVEVKFDVTMETRTTKRNHSLCNYSVETLSDFLRFVTDMVRKLNVLVDFRCAAIVSHNGKEITQGGCVHTSDNTSISTDILSRVANIVWQCTTECDDNNLRTILDDVLLYS